MSVRAKTLSLVALSSLLGLSACGGGMAGDSDDTAGFEYDAEQSSVDDAIGDLDPVNITFQTLPGSEQGLMGGQAILFQDLVEERSNGQIEVEIIWGMGAAGFDEVRQAVVDGRIDIGYTNPIYYPEEFPVMNAYATASALIPTDPFKGELVAQAVGRELAVSDQAINEEFASQDLVPLVHIMNNGYVNMCNQPVRELDEFSGQQVRIPSVAQSTIVSELGGTGVSMDITETYEALQRGTVSCIFTQAADSVEFGYADVATEVGYAEEHFIHRSPAVMFAGPAFNDLPLPYQQILYDGLNESIAPWTKGGIDGWAQSFERALDAGGSIEPLSDDTEDAIGSVTDDLIEGHIEDGDLPESIREDIAQFEEKWDARATELGYENGGDIADLADWYEEDVDLEPWFEELTGDESLTGQRPE
ncbi:C4-dicarboxylate ABC transporter substrate-binding protein [Nesterenkonia sp. LB17]|uniref:C4-dicarboxylate ABC transporter substrate-binding protein n=1 Tax=Nesterenkonia sp. LB17 TaxID=2901230 RepID=UPI001F4C8EC7|nr:C4-dicarboxylate ABC transporter substrate-binding protein [Nesterenkonia sp. LB17]MCH8565264.1 C4-dicarboxylate ABC transporter substrate-binding protein [Nesterenkonia sp. LB17]